MDMQIEAIRGIKENTIEKVKKKNKFTNLYKEKKKKNEENNKTKFTKILKKKCPEVISVGVALLILWKNAPESNSMQIILPFGK